MMTSEKHSRAPARRGVPGGRPIIAVTAGDPAGVGPEIVARLFGGGFRARRAVFVIVGARTVLRPLLENYGAAVTELQAPPRGADLQMRSRAVAAALLETVKTRGGPRVFLADSGCRERYSLCKDTRGGGRHAGAALELACRLALDGVVDGLVTAPISKHALALAGYSYTGHTEMFRDVFAAPDCQMFMVYKEFRVVPLTRHIPLARVSRALTQENVAAGLLAVHRALQQDFGVLKPRIAVSGLNPHAGDGGLVGREEIESIVPAIQSARRRGMRITGPLPGDALFQAAADGVYDAFVAMYHDQGLIPFKMVSKKRGVNVTTGLPVVRTSVDHGVAYDIAGRGLASTASL
ncbi:MAG: 4-hydroxythreonine-4-phosphate dehydrogenase PdxA, partial [bacterium]